VRRAFSYLLAVSHHPLPRQRPLRARTPYTQQLHAHLRATISPEALETLALGRLCGAAEEVAGGTGAVARIIAQLLECVREAVPTAHAQAATSPPAAPLAGSDLSSGSSTVAAVAAVPDVVVGDDRFDMPVSVAPACLVEMTLRKSGCGPCSHARCEEAGGGSPARTPRGYCEQCGHYRHVNEAARTEELKRYCVQCERPCCLECALAERHNRSSRCRRRATISQSVSSSTSHASYCVLRRRRSGWR